MILLLVLQAAWPTGTPAEAGIDRAGLDRLRDLVRGRGCVVRHGRMVYTWGDVTQSSDVASAFKPLLSTLLHVAIREGKLKSVDEKLSAVEPRLTGKNAEITWRHLASQTSGYGLAEEPGKAYAYNDYALALYYDTLMDKVFREPGTEVLKSRLGKLLQFEDPHTFEAFGPKDRPGRLAMSVRDLARFGEFILRNRLKEEFRAMFESSVPADLPLTAGGEGEMIPGQRTIGGTKNITPVGPGYYSFNWWLNRGRRLFVDAPADAIVASGHGGMRMLWILPGLDMVVVWNDTVVRDHDKSPGNSGTRANRAAQVLVDAARPVLGARGGEFTLNGAPTFLLGVSYYAGLGAPDAVLDRDLDEMKRLGFNWVRVWATWAAFGNDVSAVDAEGYSREAHLKRLEDLVARCGDRGMVVDVTLSRENGITGGPRLQTLEAHGRAVKAVVGALGRHRNWMLDLSNERNIKDKRFTSFADLKALREIARSHKEDLLVTASHAGELTREDLQQYLETVRVDFLSPHRPRNAESPGQSEERALGLHAWMTELGRVVPLQYQEPFRRGYGKWVPRSEDFRKDLAGGRKGGAAGWCFHNGDERDAKDGVPRRSFDLREKGLFEQFDDEERKFLKEMK